MFVPARGRVGYTLRRSVGRGDHTPPEPPMKIGGLRGDILFESKEYPLALPKKDSGRDFEFPSQTLLETTKGRAAALPLETFPKVTKDFEETGRGRFAARLRGTLGRGTEARDGVPAVFPSTPLCGKRG